MLPRYHFCAGEGQFWQRPAYTQGGDATHVCRMIGLGNVQAETKGRRKWLHALSLTPMGAMAPATLAQVRVRVRVRPPSRRLGLGLGLGLRRSGAIGPSAPSSRPITPMAPATLAQAPATHR